MITTTELQNPAKAREYFENKLAFTTGPAELNQMIEVRQDINVVDVRDAEDFEEGHIPGAVNCPRTEWDSCENLDKDRTNVLYCYTQQCHLAAKAAVEFSQKGYPVMELEGGFATWKDYGFDIEK